MKFSWREPATLKSRNRGSTIFSCFKMNFLGPPRKVILKQEKPLLGRFGPILLSAGATRKFTASGLLLIEVNFQFARSCRHGVKLKFSLGKSPIRDKSRTNEKFNFSRNASREAFRKKSKRTKKSARWKSRKHC